MNTNQFESLPSESEISTLAQQSFDEQFEQRWLDAGHCGGDNPKLPAGGRLRRHLRRQAYNARFAMLHEIHAEIADKLALMRGQGEPSLA